MFQLFPWQEPALRALKQSLEVYHAALDASDTGAGKTYIAAALAKELNLIPVVVAPKPALPNWNRVLKGFGHDRCAGINYEMLVNGKYENHHLGQWHPVGAGRPERFAWELPPGCLLIFDEVHRCRALKGPMRKVTGYKTRQEGRCNGRLIEAAINQDIPLLMCSATVAEDPKHLKWVGGGLRLFQCPRGWFPWARMRGLKKNHMGVWEFNGELRHTAKIHEEVFGEGRGVRLRHRDIPDFPDNVLSTELLEYGPKLHKAGKALQQRLDELAEEQEDAVTALEHVLRERQLFELAKVPALAETAENAVQEGNSVVLFVNYLETLEALHKALSAFEPAIIRGGQKDREEQRRHFQDNKTRVCLVQIQAGGESIDLHDIHGGFPRVSLISPPVSAVQLRQALGRIHRAGSKSPAVQRILFAADTYEERACELVAAKLEHLDTINDGDLLGVEETPMPKKEEPAPDTKAEPTPADPSAPETIITAAHHPHGPSSLYHKEICPGFRGGDSGEAAEQGNRCHDALENDHRNNLSDEETEWVDMCAEAREHIKDGLIREHGPIVEILREVKLGIDGLNFGTFDHFYRTAKHGALVDYKFGWVEVPDAEVNPQGQNYALFVFDKYPELESVDVYFLQPKWGTVTSHRYTRADYQRLYDRIRLIIDRAEAYEADPAGHQDLLQVTDQCRYCGARARCPALANRALVLHRGYMPDIPMPDLLHPEQMTDPQDVATGLKLARVMEEWQKAMKSRAMQMVLDEGLDLPGFELVHRKGKRVIDAQGAFGVVNELFGIQADEFTAACTVSVTALEKMVKDRQEKGKGAAAVRQLNQTLQEEGHVTGGDEYPMLKVLKTDAKQLGE